MSVWHNDWGKSDLPEFNTNQCYKGLADKQVVCITNLCHCCHCSGVEVHGIKLGFCHPSLTFFLLPSSLLLMWKQSHCHQPSFPTRWTILSGQQLWAAKCSFSYLIYLSVTETVWSWNSRTIGPIESALCWRSAWWMSEQVQNPVIELPRELGHVSGWNAARDPTVVFGSWNCNSPVFRIDGAQTLIFSWTAGIAQRTRTGLWG